MEQAAWRPNGDKRARPMAAAARRSRYGQWDDRSGTDRRTRAQRHRRCALRLTRGPVRDRLAAMAELSARKRARLPDSAFAYIDSKGKRRLPIHDRSHVRNALARFDRVAFEDEAAKERARQRLLRAAKKHGIVPIGFFNGQLRSGTREAAAGRLVIELGR